VDTPSISSARIPTAPTNITASSLRRLDGRTAAVAALLEDLANPFSAELHRALEDVAHEHGVLIFAGSVDEDPVRERQLVRAFTARRADGLLLVPASEDQSYLAADVAAGTAVVCLDRAPTRLAVDAVVTTNMTGAVDGVRHLAAAGHRRIGYLGDRIRIPTAAERYRGYCEGWRRPGSRWTRRSSPGTWPTRRPRTAPPNGCSRCRRRRRRSSRRRTWSPSARCGHCAASAWNGPSPWWASTTSPRPICWCRASP
jgi:hypothetical protein